MRKNLFFLALLVAAVMAAPTFGQTTSCGGAGSINPLATENFDGATAGSAGTGFPAGWTDGGGTQAWSVEASGVGNSSSTGPNADHTSGTGNYMYTETSSGAGNPGNDFILNAPAFDATGLTDPGIEFWYHMWGSALYELHLEQFDGVNWNSVWVTSGDQGDVWRQAVVGLTPDAGNMIIVRFHYYTHPAPPASNFLQDAAIDDVSFGDTTVPNTVSGATYETNSPEASLTVDGVLVADPVCGPGAVIDATLAGSPYCGTMVLSTNQSGGIKGGQYEIALQAGPLVSGVDTGNGELANIDLAQPIVWMNGGAAGADFFAMPGTQFPGSQGGSMTVEFCIGCPISFTMQAVVLDDAPAPPNDYFLSQATQINVALDPTCTDLSATASDDGSQMYTPTAPITFYGTSYSDIFVATNGRVEFVGPDGDFTPTVGEGLTDNPFVGPWTDLRHPLGGGGCLYVCDDGAGNVSVRWESLQHWNDGSVRMSATVSFAATGEITIDGMENVGGFGEEMFLGITQGNLGATDPGMVDYTLGAGTTANATDMIYRYTGTASELAAPGIGSITFTPNALMNYDWSAF